MKDSLDAYHTFPEKFQSVILATVSDQGVPHSSYAPFVMDSDKNIYLLASTLAIHTQDLRTTGKASALFIEDERDSPKIFARTRLTFDCTVMEIERDTPEWNARVNQLQDRQGEVVGMIRQLLDFHLLQLTPTGGRFVSSFGKIFDIGEDLKTLKPVGRPKPSAK
ncbi:MAG: pyridoxamine 5'-phosphate oxidase family protein [Cyanobacteria bacterium P01_F01_bin.150]